MSSAKDNQDENVAGKSFREKIYQQVAKIPPGYVASYGGIAALAGFPGAAREVGQVMSRVPEQLNLPCHRVIYSNGAMAPGAIFGGEQAQRALLMSEGVRFKKNGCVDMAVCQWPQQDDFAQLQLLFGETPLDVDN